MFSVGGNIVFDLLLQSPSPPRWRGGGGRRQPSGGGVDPSTTLIKLFFHSPKRPPILGATSACS